jgi:hypothetical protein
MSAEFDWQDFEDNLSALSTVILLLTREEWLKIKVNKTI